MSVLELGHYIRTYPSALTADFCQSVIAHFDSTPQCQLASGRGVLPALEESAWVELDLTRTSVPGVSHFLSGQVQHYYQRYVQELGLTLPVSPPKKMSNVIVKRYAHDADSGFQPHFDSLREVCNRYLVFLWYLNDVAVGGHTEFVDLGISVQPEQGMLLIFPPYWMFQHAGRPPISGDKMIMSAYLEY